MDGADWEVISSAVSPNGNPNGVSVCSRVISVRALTV